MDMNACDIDYPAQRADGSWGIANDYYGYGCNSGRSFATREECERAIQIGNAALASYRRIGAEEAAAQEQRNFERGI